MASQQSTPENRIPKIVKPSLKFWVIIPIFVLLILFLLALLGFAFITRQTPPFELFLFAIASFLAVVGIALLITRQIARRFDNWMDGLRRELPGPEAVRTMLRAAGHTVADMQRQAARRAFGKLVAGLE